MNKVEVEVEVEVDMVNIPLPRYPLYQGPRTAHLGSCDVDTSFL